VRGVIIVSAASADRSLEHADDVGGLFFDRDVVRQRGRQVERDGLKSRLWAAATSLSRS
jgi:hypothetical protein